MTWSIVQVKPPNIRAVIPFANAPNYGFILLRLNYDRFISGFPAFFHSIHVVSIELVRTAHRVIIPVLHLYLFICKIIKCQLVTMFVNKLSLVYC